VGDFTVLLDTSMKAQQQTAVRALYDKDYLYIAMVCDEPNVTRLVKLAKKRDETAYSDDRIEVLIGAPGSDDTYYDFALTAGGVQYDARSRAYSEPFVVYKPTGRVQSTKNFHETDVEWNTEWASASGVGEGHWTAETAIPLAGLGINASETRIIRANFGRVRATYVRSWGRRYRPNPKPEHSVWSPPKGDMGTPALFGFIALRDEDGNVPKTPKAMKVAVPGLPGIPGVPSDEPAPTRVRFTVERDGPTRKLPRFWDGLSSRSADLGIFERTFVKGYCTKVRLDRPWPRRVKLVDGKLQGDMSSADRLFEVIKKHKVTAIVTLRKVPSGIEYLKPEGNRIGRPLKNEKDYQVIYENYKAYFQYLYNRYGREFFDTLRFEFWNEPDWAGKFFGGTVDEYCKWYDWVAKALKDVSPTGKIGGPTVTGGGFEFAKAFLQHCSDGGNAATGGKGAPVDFVSFHTYGWRAQLTPYAYDDTILTMGRIWKIINDTGFGGTEIYVSEWGVEPTGWAGGPCYWFRKTHYAPVWMAKLVKETHDAVGTYSGMNARMDGMLLHLGATVERPPFHGTRSLFIDRYVPKPYYNGYVLLNELGGERLTVEGPDGPRIGCMPTKRPDGSLVILVFHFKEYARTSPPEENVAVELAGLPIEGMQIRQMRVDEKTSNSYTAWVEMGSPEEITDEIAARLAAAAEVQKAPLKANEAGIVELNMPVNSVAVVLVERSPQE